MSLYLVHASTQESRNSDGCNAVIVDAGSEPEARVAAEAALPPGSRTTAAWKAHLLSGIVPVVIEGNAIPPGRFRGRG